MQVTSVLDCFDFEQFDVKLNLTVPHLFVLYLRADVLKEGLLKLAPSSSITCCDTKNTSPPTTKELEGMPAMWVMPLFTAFLPQFPIVVEKAVM